MTHNPNATVALTVGWVAAGIVWVLNLLGVNTENLPDPVKFGVAGVVISLVLYVGREGVVPTVRRLLFGPKKP